MSSKVYVIDSQECPGDALSKINANFVALQNAVCNMQTDSKFFDEKTNNIEKNIELFVYDANKIIEKDNLYTRVYKTIKSLSPYWRSKQYTLFVPPHLLSPFITNKPEAIRVSVINKRLPIEDYPDFTIVNAIFTNFSKNVWPETYIEYPSLSSIPHLNEYSHTIYRYIKTSNGWLYVESIEHADSAEAVPEITDTTSRLLLSATNTLSDGKYSYITLTARLSSMGSIVNLPATDYFSWEWYINDSHNTPLPISSISLSPGGTTYSGNGAVAIASSVSSIQLQIQPNRFTDLPEVSSLYVIGYDYSDSVTRSSIITLPVGDMPDKSILNAEIDVYDVTGTSPGDTGTYIGSTSNTTAITRENNSTRRYRLNPKIFIKPYTPDYKVSWITNTYTDSCTTSRTLISSATFAGANIIEINVPESSSTTIKLSAYDVDTIAWANKHTVVREFTINHTPTLSVNIPEFIVYSKYVWSPNITVIDASNYTDTIPTTAYGGRVDLTAEFYVSASPGFTEYEWKVGEYRLTSTTNTTLLKIPYSRDIFSERGIPVELSAYNTCLPSTNKINTYIDYDGSTKVYPNTAITDNSNTNIQKKNIRLLPYANILYGYVLTSNDLLDISNDNKIKIHQYIKPLNTNNATELISGTITYKIYTSTWSTEAVLPAQDGEYTLACLQDGDADLPLYIDGSTSTDVSISSSAIFTTRIKNNLGEWESLCTPGVYIDYDTYIKPVASRTPTPTPTPTKTIYYTATPSVTRTPRVTPVDTCETLVTDKGVGTFTYNIPLSLRPDTVRVSYNTYDIPDNIIVLYNDIRLHQTGFVGSRDYEDDLIRLYGSSSTVVGPGVGWFDVNLSGETAPFKPLKVVVEAPLANSQWVIKVNCLPRNIDITPTPTPTLTNTPTGVDYVTSTPTRTVTRSNTPTPTPTSTSAPVTTDIINCDETVHRSGSGSYWFSVNYLPNTTKKIVISYNTYSVPDRFVVYRKKIGSTVYQETDTGFRGDISYNVSLLAIGRSVVSGTGIDDIVIDSIDHNNSEQIFLYVDAPLADTEFDIKMTCINEIIPVTPTSTCTPTITPTLTNTPTPTDASLVTHTGVEIIDIDI